MLKCGKRFTRLYNSPPSIMHGVSAFGTRLCFYLFDKGSGRITPPQGSEPSKDFVVDTAPLELWDDDICQPNGYDRFMESVDRAKMVGLGECMLRIFTFFNALTMIVEQA